MKTALRLLAAFAAIFGTISLIGVFLADWEPPRPQVTQIGYRGVGMQQLDNLRAYAAKISASAVPTAQDPAEPGGQLASQAYQNVKVLGGLTENEFNRLMLAITEWVSPEQGCEYCHNPENLAEDSKYTKLVARRMLQMTNHVNAGWKTHVGATGVTCYTCHRGKPVPAEIWFEQAGETRTAGLLGYRAGQNAPSAAVGLSSLPNDPFSSLLAAKQPIRVAATTALPTSLSTGGTKAAEKTYGLMIHMSEALGVNCTFCHNSRAFGNWQQSTPQRVTAWHGINMVRDLNISYLVPLKSTLPAERLGPLGDAPKAYCATCHRGLAKPLNGALMLKDYPELNKVKLD
jgi:photosynthetic reaction center cytochrome c subunit